MTERRGSDDAGPRPRRPGAPRRKGAPPPPGGAGAGGPGPGVALVPIVAGHRRELAPIVRDPRVMRWVADGKTWDDAKLSRFCRYCAREEKESAGSREYFYWGVLAGGAFSGVVGVHPVAYGPGAPELRCLTVFLAPAAAGRGVGTAACRAAVDLYSRARPGAQVHADILHDNGPMLRLAEKLGSSRAGGFCRGPRRYLRFLLPGGGGRAP